MPKLAQQVEACTSSPPAQLRRYRPGPFLHRPSWNPIMTRLKTSKLLRATALTLASGLCTAGWAADRAPDLRNGQWVQWLYSIPTSVNPVNDSTGQHCMVGQSGSTWRLAPRFGGGEVQRACTVPQGVKLQFAVAGSAYIYTPGFCGDVPGTPVRDLRAAIAAFTDTLTVNVLLDGQPVAPKRVRSAVFDAALPVDNLFVQGCGGPGSVPAGIYRAVDDSYYAEIDNLAAGIYRLELLATNGGTFNQKVVYTLTVVARDPN
jgi:hypothetical protein